MSKRALAKKNNQIDIKSIQDLATASSQAVA